MSLKSDNIEIMIGSEADEIINKVFEFFPTRYQLVLEESVKGSNFVFNGINGMYYKCCRICLNREGLYIDSPDWIKTKNKSKWVGSNHENIVRIL